MKIYTKTGDSGQTSLYNGARVKKSHELIHATGTVDECNSLLGSCLAYIRADSQLLLKEPTQALIFQVERIQSYLFSLGAHLATPRQTQETSSPSPQGTASIKTINEDKQRRTQFSPQFTLDLEQWIDQWQLLLPPLKHFILPGGHIAAAAFHHARCECRHAERHLCPIYEKGLIDQTSIHFINRLSDYLFVVARIVNHLTQTQETIWQPC